MNKHSTIKGFTLLEMLLVIAIIAILAGIVIVAINPVKQLGDANNTKRLSDIRALNSAVKQYTIDNRGIYPDVIVSTLTEVCNTGSEEEGHGIDCDDLIDLSFLVPDYISEIPVDPEIANGLSYFVNTAFAQGATNGTGYMIKRDGAILTTAAPYTDNIDSGDDLILSVGEEITLSEFPDILEEVGGVSN